MIPARPSSDAALRSTMMCRTLMRLAADPNSSIDLSLDVAALTSARGRLPVVTARISRLADAIEQALRAFVPADL